MSSHKSRTRKFRFNTPQRIAAALLLCFLLQCVWVISHQSLTERDYDYARCGREMWERPSPLAGYFTTCGNIHDGSLAYRLAGLPLTLNVRLEQLLDKLRKPEDRIFPDNSGPGSTWEMRHQLTHVLLLIRLPFVIIALVLGGALWWVSRRLFGNLGGYTATALYCFSPAIIQATLSPNPEILTTLFLYGGIYTAIGVAHALQGPRKKWRPRILLLTTLFGLLACSHIAALGVALFMSVVLMAWLAEGRRTAIIPIISVVFIGSLLVLFACYAFQPDAASYVLRSSAATLGFSLTPAGYFFRSPANLGITTAAVVAFLLYLAGPRTRYFGNTAPLLIAVILFVLITTGVAGQPWLWALPFLHTFIAGVFADGYESPRGRLFLLASGSLVLLQAALSIATLSNLFS
jgi:hypothetical protein